MTKPYNPYGDRSQKESIFTPSIPSVSSAVIRSPGAAARRSHAEGELAQMRAQKAEMMRDYMQQKQMLSGK